jgi:hypothetical protein
MYEYLSKEQKTKLYRWKRQDPGIVENFANYVKTGFLFASPVIVELYCWFISFRRENKTIGVQEKYRDFIEFVKPKVADSLMLEYFKEAMDSFTELCEKIVDHKMNDWKKAWRSLKSLQNPASPASGQSGNRQRLIMGFNSPFYPNVLIATSVFQEGVNLHLQCRNVHHYGIAWTPGDNEQRVGRVDRLFGRINKELKRYGKTNLNIYYPYLSGSFDEDQVGSFIRKKYLVEAEMDACIQEKFDRKIDTTTMEWKEYLRKPIVHQGVFSDPYPAKFDKNIKESERYKPAKVHPEVDVSEHLRSMLKEILSGENEELFDVNQDSHLDDAVFLLDPRVEKNDEVRHQPILIERSFSSRMSGLIDGTVYYISMKTPISSEDNFSAAGIEFDRLVDIYDSLKSDYPLIRLAIDEKAANSHFFLQMQVNLPIFVSDEKLQQLSKVEMHMAYEQLRDCSDLLEQALFVDKGQDLKREHLKVRKRLAIGSNNTDSSRFQNPIEKNQVVPSSGSVDVNHISENWVSKTSVNGPVVSLNEHLNLKDFAKAFAADINTKNININDSHATQQQLLLLNFKYPFIRFSVVQQVIELELSFPGVDMQEDEKELMELWFGNIVEK